MRAWKRLSRYILGTLFVLAGGNHFLHTDLYAEIMPPYLPWPAFLVYLSGFFEAVLGGLLLWPRFTRLAAWGLVALLVVVFPANIHMALHPGLFPRFSPALLWGRLPFQFLFIAWVYWHTRDDF